MIDVRAAIARWLRGPRVLRLLEALGVDPRRYWLLVDLFDDLSERGEMLDQLGSNGVALRIFTWILFAVSALMSVLLLPTRPDPSAYFLLFLSLTGVLLLLILLPETANSLVNPVEGLVLAHQPINGATYTAAKLTHLARIVLFLVAGLNAVPAIAGLVLDGSPWSYPVIHLLAALAVGVVLALLCCALFGWLLRLVPASRLKAAAQVVATLPLLGLFWGRELQEWSSRLSVADWMPAAAGARWTLGLLLAVAVVAVVVAGLRCLTADYLIRVSSLVHGRRAAGVRPRRSWLGGMVARTSGGQPARAGFTFVSRLMLRDWQFLRQILPMVVVVVISLAPLVARGWRVSPFARQFTTLHLLPHVLGFVSFAVCTMLAYGNNFKGAWIFRTVPAQAFDRVARGVHALLWIQVVLIPHAIVLVWLTWSLGWWQGWLFVAYSAAVASAYLALELRLIDGMPFSRQADASRGAFLVPLLMMGGLAVGMAVALQYFLVFRSPTTVVIVTAVVAPSAYFLTRASLDAFATSIRDHLGSRTEDTATLFTSQA